METHYKGEMMIDNYLRAHFARDTQLTEGIEPSGDFVQQTMKRIRIYDHRRQIVQDGMAVVFAVSPVFLRQVWLWNRQDYFSVASLPFGQTILDLYGFFLSAITLYGFMALGLVFLLSYVLKFRRDFPMPVRQMISW